jgi:hypothetical protein
MVRIISTHLGDPRFIYYQKMLLDKFISDEFEFIVFDDSNNTRNSFNKNSDSSGDYGSDSVEKICKDLSIRRITVPINVHDNPSLVHKDPRFINNDPCGWCANSVQFSVNWCFENLSDDDIVLSIDGDMFPIAPVDLISFLSNYSLAGVSQQRDEIEYVWNGIFIFKMGEIDKEFFQWSPIPKCDVGGMMSYYLQKNPAYKRILHLWSMTWNTERIVSVNDQGVPPHIVDFLRDLDYQIPDPILEFSKKDPRNINRNGEELFFSEIYHPGFLHYRASGNWDGYNSHEKRKNMLFNSFDLILKNE